GGGGGGVGGVEERLRREGVDRPREVTGGDQRVAERVAQPRPHAALQDDAERTDRAERDRREPPRGEPLAEEQRPTDQDPDRLERREQRTVGPGRARDPDREQELREREPRPRQREDERPVAPVERHAPDWRAALAHPRQREKERYADELAGRHHGPRRQPRERELRQDRSERAAGLRDEHGGDHQRGHGLRSLRQ